MPVKLQISIIWKDQDMIEVEVNIDTGQFAGVAKTYASAEDLYSFGERIKGFPFSIDDMRGLSIGDTHQDYSKISISLRMIDNYGHCSARVEISDYRLRHNGNCVNQTLAAEMNFEPCEIDSFSKSLQSMGKTWEGCAILNGLSA